ncbi:MAG: hypothetical protein HY291_08230 [Planctomycetes bacterium]|nr:hypothetical protein [Planctomycetota bacterium]
MEEALLEKLSAYADGELEGAEAAELSAALEARPELRRMLDAFKRLDEQVAALPVPPLDDETGRALWSEVSFRTLEAQGKPGAKPLETPSWNAMAEGLPPAPEVSADRWGKVWQGIRGGMQPGAKSEEPRDEADRSVPLGDLSPIHLAAVKDREPFEESRKPRKRPVAFWFSAAAMAAALVAAVATFVFRDDTGAKDGPVAAEDLQGAAVLNDRYFMLTKHVQGVESPVVCFFLKDDGPDVNQH